MGIPVLIMGAPSSGKTYSLKYYEPGEIGIIGVEKTRLPFRSKIKVFPVPERYFVKNKDGANVEVTDPGRITDMKYSWIEKAIAGKLKTYAIDDSQYLLANEVFDRANEKGYDKWTFIAKHFRDLIHYINKSLPDDVIVFLLHHSEDDGTGKQKCKTVGKMLNSLLEVEGLFNIILFASDWKFYTQPNNTSTARTPEEMFSDVQIDNNLKEVEKAIREYYYINTDENTEEN